MPQLGNLGNMGDGANLENVGHNKSVIHQVDAIIKSAIEKSASDIHIESTSDGARLRYRIDGVLYDQSPVQEQRKSQVISRIKVLSKINLAEKRIPQDGKFRISHNALEGSLGSFLIDLRVSTFPSIYGEKVVIRILDRSRTMITLNALGFEKNMRAIFTDLVERPTGFVLVTGPTGSGKTTTLYAALSHLNSPEKNIITLEDPVEYNLNGITQGQIHPDAGFTFAKGIRSVLRQDPDIAMVGEIRDKETAQIAIEASLTGHQVFSTLHTNDAPGAIMRLMDMGVEPFLINAALTGVLAQRLARTICPDCKTSKSPTLQEKKIMDKLGLDLDKLYTGTGCDTCFGLGYKGRTGIFELLVMSSELRVLIVEHPKFDAIKSRAMSDGMQPMLKDGIAKVKSGTISLEELIRVVW
ncbi:GspE/PulE family protein [Candidatus Dependentiae bacterium]